MFDVDQAATLRRLFARPTLRLLPVLLPELHCATRTSWVAKLAQAFARHGERTLVVDAARAQVAAALGLRARFDLAHAVRGECPYDATLVDAGPDLMIVPAARALQLAQAARTSLTTLLAPLDAALAARGGCDLILLLVPATAVATVTRLPVGDLLVPLLPEAVQINRSLRELDTLAAHLPAEDARTERAVTTAFRLLFLGMDAGSAATLAQRLALRPPAAHRPVAVQFAGAVQVGRDLGGVIRATGGWSLARMELTQRGCGERCGG